MDEYKAILKLINDELTEQESVIKYYRDEQKEWEERCAELTHTNFELNKVNEILKEKIDGFEKEKDEILQVIQDEEAENKQLREKIASLEEKIAEYETPKKVANV